MEKPNKIWSMIKESEITDQEAEDFYRWALRKEKYIVKCPSYFIEKFNDFVAEYRKR